MLESLEQLKNNSKNTSNCIEESSVKSNLALSLASESRAIITNS